MATYYLPSSSTYYDTSNDYVKYRIRIVEGTYNSSTRTIPITVQAYFYRTNSGYTTDYAHTLKYTINGTAYSYTNAYGAYPITSSGVYMNSCTVSVPVNDNGTVSITCYCQYTSTNSSNLTTSNNGGSISLTTQAAKTYTVSFNANGGSGAPSSQTKYHGTNLTLSSTVPTKSGYTFKGWGTSSSSTSATYSAGGSYTANASATLYAVWSKTLTLTYNANGGSGAPSSQSATVYNSTTSYTFTVSSTKPTRTDYTFAGWSTSSSASSASYSAGGSISISANTTLYAVWVENLDTYTITYHTNGGIGTPTPQYKTEGTNITLTSHHPVRSGYTFKGWSTSSTATSATYTAGATFSTNANTVLYAVWSRNASQSIYLCADGTAYASELVENESFGFTSYGQILANTFTEGTLSSGDFALCDDVIASEFIEGTP